MSKTKKFIDMLKEQEQIDPHFLSLLHAEEQEWYHYSQRPHITHKDEDKQN